MGEGTCTHQLHALLVLNPGSPVELFRGEGADRGVHAVLSVQEEGAQPHALKPGGRRDTGGGRSERASLDLIVGSSCCCAAPTSSAGRLPSPIPPHPSSPATSLPPAIYDLPPHPSPLPPHYLSKRDTPSPRATASLDLTVGGSCCGSPTSSRLCTYKGGGGGGSCCGSPTSSRLCTYQGGGGVGGEKHSIKHA